MIGQTISHYCILEKLGGRRDGRRIQSRGHQARSLRRAEVPPDEVARDAQVLSRFRREAKAASALNYPNICTVHEIDEEDGQTFIEMEFPDGITPKHRIAGRPSDI
jgi:eukaryotic-like serine/threonine-protein kinase